MLGWVGHAGVGWVIQGWGGHEGVGWVMLGWVSHATMGWVMLGWGGVGMERVIQRWDGLGHENIENIKLLVLQGI